MRKSYESGLRLPTVPMAAEAFCPVPRSMAEKTDEDIVLEINENSVTPTDTQHIEYVGEKNRRRRCLNARGQSIHKRIDHGDKLKAIT